MNFSHLQAFQLVAELGNMTRAAEQLNVAQPALSKTIANLEQQFGVPLFDRRGRRLELNPCGEVLLKRVKAIFNELEQAKQELADLAGDDTGHVTVGVTTSQILPNLFATYLSQHPEIKFRLFQVAGRYEIANQLRDGVVDLCITSLPLEYPGEANSVAVQTLMSEKICLAVASDHPLAEQTSVTLDDIAHEKFISYPQEDGIREITDRVCQQAGFRPNVVFESFDSSVIAHLVRDGVGVALMSESWWQGATREHLVKLPIAHDAMQRSILLSWMDNRYLSPAARNFCEFIGEYAKLMERDALLGEFS